MAPLFSFVIPNFNYGQYLAESIDSCLAQEVDSEIIVIDGGSTDNTVDVLKSYGDKIIWVSEKDKGQSDAINKGIARATGQYIAWINSDDYYDNTDAFKKMVSYLAEHPETDFIYGDVKYVQDDGSFYRLRKQDRLISLKTVYTQPFEAIVQPEVIFRRELFQAVGGVDLKYHYSMDLDLWIRMLLKTDKLHYIDTTVACARIHPAAKTQKHIRKSISETRGILKKYKKKLTITPMDRLKVIRSMIRVELYYWAVELKLVRPTQ